MLADVHLAVRPRGDIALLNGIMRVLLDEGLVDLDAVRGHVDGLDELARPPRRLDGRAGGRRERHRRRRRSATSPARSGGPSAACSRGRWASTTRCRATRRSRCSTRSPLLTGNIGRPGAAPMSITGQCNAMGTRETGFTASMPGYRAYDDPAARAELAALLGHRRDRGCRPSGGGPTPTSSTPSMSGKIKALWIIGTNPVVSFPNREVARARPRPASTCSSCRTGSRRRRPRSPTSCCRRRSGARRTARSPTASGGCPGCGRPSLRPATARTDFDIFLAVAERWGCGDLFAGWTSPQDAFEEWRRVSAGRPCDYSGITWERIDAAGGVQWPCPTATTRRAARRHAAPLHRPPLPPPRAAEALVHRRRAASRSATRHAREFPLLLNTGRTVEHWHTRTKTGRVADPRGPGARGVGRDAPRRRRRARRALRRLGAGHVVHAARSSGSASG